MDREKGCAQRQQDSGQEEHSDVVMNFNTKTYIITRNDHSFDCPIICTDIYSQYYCFHWHLQQCLIQSSSFVNQEAIFVDNC